MSFGTEPFATEVVLDSSTASDAVTTCVLDAARVWGFPRPVLEDHTFSRQFVLPIDPMVDGEATDRSVE
jgi:hypothetical protein